MKIRTLSTKLTALFLAAVLLLGAFTLGIFAAGDDYAADFKKYVNYAGNAESLSEKSEYLTSAAEKLDLYVNAGGSTEDAAIADAYQSYVSMKEDVDERVGYCNQFMEYVNLAYEPDIPFAELMSHLDAAESLLPKVDKKYTGMSGVISQYRNLRSSLEEPIEICQTFISKACKAAEATTFGEASRAVADAEFYKTLIEIEDYPGLDEAEANLLKATAFMSECINNAMRFIHAVEDIEKAESIPVGIKNARDIFEEDNVDETAAGADTALSKLRTTELEYDRKVRRANSSADNASSLMFGLIF